jgi:hypothetical protein
MKVQHTLLYLLGFITTIQALAVPAAFSSLVDSGAELYKRKGGGGGRGGGGTSSGSSGGRTSGSNTGSSGSRGSSGSTSGTGTPRSFGGGSRYAGGATQPYRAGGTPSGWRGPAPVLLGVGALALFPGLWLYGAYSYRYPNDERQTYYNETSGQNETRHVECLCAANAQCGCDDTNDQTCLNEVANNNSISSVKNGTLYINGTLTDDTTAPGTASSAAGGSLTQRLVEASGYWPIVAGVAYTMWFL